MDWFTDEILPHLWHINTPANSLPSNILWHDAKNQNIGVREASQRHELLLNTLLKYISTEMNAYGTGPHWSYIRRARKNQD
jgi:hypothetical protein